MKIIDCILFYNEIDMLLYHLKELNDIVDIFIIIESNYTFAGNKKILYYDENKDKFIKYKTKIKHLIINDMPNDGNAWNNEYHQRKSVTRVLDKMELNDDDYLIISDVDEIANKKKLVEIKKNKYIGVNILVSDMYYYNLECKAKKKWYDLKIVDYQTYLKYNKDVQKIRTLYRPVRRISNGGWHFSYFGDINFIKNKIQNIAHQEFNKLKYLKDEQIKTQIKNCDDLFFRDNKRTHGFYHENIEDNDFLPENYKDLINLNMKIE